MHIAEVPFTVPVTIRLQCGLDHTFHSVYDALDFLEGEWPLRHGQRYDRAVELCRKALKRLVSGEVAREAFIAACLEASMPLVFPMQEHGLLNFQRVASR